MVMCLRAGCADAAVNVGLFCVVGCGSFLWQEVEGCERAVGQGGFDVGQYEQTAAQQCGVDVREVGVCYAAELSPGWPPAA